MTHVAYFRVGLTGSGTPTETSGWNAIADDLVEAAHAVGTKVHLTVAVFDEATQNSVLGNATNRANAVSAALAALVNERGADGVNVDFEGTPYGQKDNLVSFVTALKAEVDEVYVDTPAVDWSGAYDYSGLSDASDGLFVMAYDYHWGAAIRAPWVPCTAEAHGAYTPWTGHSRTTGPGAPPTTRSSWVCRCMGESGPRPLMPFQAPPQETQPL